ncbi:response regulator transcription factor [Paraburkholderia aromaticivorans]|uniref:DNA-binding response regulator n=1 Tax=Paraburkholderia aromaticivorans TaxID=2026199 RepID=A0A248VTG7_9BURK|nr:response regulator transcription factor [Paraburkholderia aromaticivorans]ASW02173.1 DNA-binding response regulator [Paraburkholderia aromaticivorans]
MSTILVIDDHPAFRMVIKMQLMQLLGVEEVIEADNGQTAVEMARVHTPELAILDLDIPRISGLDVIPRLRLAHPPIRVMVLSGHDPATFAPRAMRSGVHGFVGKSQEMKEIMRGVEAVLAGYDCFPADSNEAEAASGLNALSAREVEVLQYLARGVSNRDIAGRLSLSDKTVSTYKSRIQEKLGLSSLAGLIEFAASHRLVD